MADDRKPMPGLGAGWPMQRLTADLLVLLALFAWWLTSLKLPERVFLSPLAVTKTLASFPFEADFWMHMAMSGLRVMLAACLLMAKRALRASSPLPPPPPPPSPRAQASRWSSSAAATRAWQWPARWPAAWT